MSHLRIKSQILLAAMACAGILSACGGGSSSSSDDASALPINNSLPVAGMVSGLGSIVVNGIRYETIGANVIDSDDGHLLNTPLGLGMIVSLQPNSINSSASTIQIQRGIQGTAANNNANLNTLTVAGLPVTTDASTLIVRANGLTGIFSDIASNSVEVYGLPQADGTFKASRIEIESIASSVQLVGVVSQLDTTNSSFKLGNINNQVTISYAASTVPAGLVNGMVLSVHTNTSVTAAQYAATQIYLRANDASTFAGYATRYAGTSGIHNETNELYGMVSALVLANSTCTLQVQGVAVSVASPSLCVSLQNGDYVEVKGLLSNGTLAAYRIEFRTSGGDRSIGGYQDDENDNDHDDLKYRRITSSGSSSGSVSPIYSAESNSAYEIYGTLSNCSGSNCTLTSNGVAINIDISTALWEHGYVVTSGAVEVKGYMTSSNVFKVAKIENKSRR
jgi:hypothetical protein